MPVPRTTVPVLVARLGEDGRLLMISDARSAGGGFVARLRLSRGGELRGCGAVRRLTFGMPGEERRRRAAAPWMLATNVNI